MSAPVMIMAGGTGGHVFPALAVAEELRSRQVPVVWLGTRRGIESRVVPAAGFAIEWMSVAGLRGRGWRRWLLAPASLLRSTWQAWRAMRRHAPRCVLGMGGFVAGPGGLIAWLSGRPLLIHEQNAVPGLTNRLLARRATCVMQAFPLTFDATIGARCTGNPVRASLLGLAPPQQRFAAREVAPLRLLVVGGSQGARALNRLVPPALALLPGADFEVWHQCGAERVEALRAEYARLGCAARVDAFIDDMAAAYAWADLALTRAGAMTVTELTVVGLGALLVPFPHAVDDHQTRNARFMVAAGAAELLDEATLTPSLLAARLSALAGARARLLDMAVKAHGLGRPDAAKTVAALCLEVCE